MNIFITDKVKQLIAIGVKKTEIAERLDIQRTTLDNRLKKHNWKKPEIKVINSW